MKKIILMLSIPVIFCSCMFVMPQPEEIVKDFAEGLENKDIDLLMSAYHDDADFLFTAPDGTEDKKNGADEIRTAQAEGFNTWESNPEVSISDWSESDGETTVTYYLIVKFGELELLNELTLTSKSGIWGILHQTVKVN